jgi:hypothetical protein
MLTVWMAAAAGVRFGRKVMATAKTGTGHPLKHRVLDLAAGAIQPKYPLDAMSTYLNGFHMYADEMARSSCRVNAVSIRPGMTAFTVMP